MVFKVEKSNKRCKNAATVNLGQKQKVAYLPLKNLWYHSNESCFDDNPAAKFLRTGEISIITALDG